MERGAQLRKRRPLRHRLEVVHRLGGLDFDSAEELAPAVGRLQDKIRVPRQLRRPHQHRDRLIVARIDGDLEFSLVFRLKQANDAVVLELLPNGPHEDGAQRVLSGVCKPGEYSTRFPACLDE